MLQKHKLRHFHRKIINVNVPRKDNKGNYAYFGPIYHLENIVKISRYIASHSNIVKYRVYRKKTVLLMGGHDGHSQQMWASLVNPSSTIKETIVLDGKLIFLSHLTSSVSNLERYGESKKALILIRFSEA